MGLMTLMCDESAKPFNLVPVKSAIVRIASSFIEDTHGEVQVLHADNSRVYRSQHLEIPMPLVVMDPEIKAKKAAKAFLELENEDTQRVSKRVMFARDGYQCQYCGYVAQTGRAKQQLTLDHVKPAHLFESRAAATTWDNVVTACEECNNKKGGHLPFECDMMPSSTPKQPTFVQLRFAGRLNELQSSYVRDYFGEKVKGVLL